MLGFDKIASLSAWARFGKPAEATGASRAELPRALEMPGAHEAVGAQREPGAQQQSAGELQVLANLSDLRAALAPEGDDSAQGCSVLRFRDDPICGVADHSGVVRPGHVFFAVPGHECDGARYAAEAVGRGAVAVVSQQPLPAPVPCFVVPDVRRAASRAASLFYGAPSRQLPVIGVTGTNGKTTVADLLRLCLEDDERAVGSLGTIEYRLGPERASAGNEVVLRARNTTPGPIDLQEYLREMVDRDVKAAVLEVSSHALDQGRTEAVDFSAAVFTNLTQDHLDYHGDMASYAAAKAKLFASLKPGGLAVLPADDPSARAMYEALPEGVEVVTYAFGSTLPDALPEGGVHVRAEILHADLDGTRICVRTPEGCVEAMLPLVGMHNARNALAAMACAIGLGVGSLRAADALSRARPVPGRLERVDDGKCGFRVFVDYAHTPDALAQVLRSLKKLTRGDVRVMFGCGGERDALKRPVMGRVAAELADHVVLTNDNPRREDPARILDQIIEGAADVSGRMVEVCPDRGHAIRHVLDQARAGDTVVLAGKGHESGQTIAGCTLPFDDKAVAKEWLSSN